MNDWTVVVDGPGDIDPRNLHALLDDWLPTESDVTVFLPERIGRSYKGLKLALTWFEEQNLIPRRYEAGQDPIKELTAAREAGQDAYLVLLWGADGDDRARALFEAAHEAGVPVKDLTGALDDLKYEDEAPAAQLQAEPEQPARRRRGSAATTTAAKPAETRAEPPEPKADEAQALIPPRMTTPAKAVVTGADTRLDELAEAFAEGMAAATLESVIRRIVRDMIRDIVRQELDTDPSEPETAAPQPDEPTSTFLLSEDGRYRIKTTRTRTKKDEQEVQLTATEASELREAGLLT